MKRIIALICALLFCCTAAVMADTEDASTVQGSIQAGLHVNPIHQTVANYDMSVVAERYAPRLLGTNAGSTNADVVKTAALEVRKQMVQRKTTIEVFFKHSNIADVNILMEQIFEEACQHTGVSYEGDSLRWDWKTWDCNAKYYASGKQYSITLNYDVKYYTSFAQEQALQTAIKEKIETLSLSGKSDAGKIQTIYDFICQNVEYDYEHLYDPGYALKHTAYAALMHKKAVCQGYAVLLYRMALECGIDARVISGYAGEPHGWNIVKIGDLYYYADSTWDAKGKTYKYFLKGKNNFLKDHSLDDGFTTAAFNKEYPVSAVDYDGNLHFHQLETERKGTGVCSDPMVVTYRCTSCTYQYEETIAGSGHQWETAHTVDKKATYQSEGSQSIHCSVCGAKDPSSVKTIAKKKCRIAAPKKVVARLCGASSVFVSWSKSRGANGYFVGYRKAGASKWNWTKGTTKDNLTIKGLQRGCKYEICVVPYVKDNGKLHKSIYRKMASTVYTLAKVKKPVAKRISPTKVSLKWKNINGETGYQVYKMKKSGGKYKKIASYKTKNTYKKIKAAKGKKYYYKVRAYKTVKVDGRKKTIYGPWSALKSYK